jgi:hypothetical protein
MEKNFIDIHFLVDLVIYTRNVSTRKFRSMDLIKDQTMNALRSSKKTVQNGRFPYNIALNFSFNHIT